MSPELVAVVLAGALGVLGTVVGAIVSTWLGRSTERRRLKAEDDRRWLGERRTTYAAYLVLCEDMLREIDGAAVFLGYTNDDAITDDDETRIAEAVVANQIRWDDELQPALSDLQLVAGGSVADLADRASGAVAMVTDSVLARPAFIDYYPVWFRAKDLVGVLRNAMRRELGLDDQITLDFPRDASWPWLPGRPSEEEYIRRQSLIPGRPPLTGVEQARLNAYVSGRPAGRGVE